MVFGGMMAKHQLFRTAALNRAKEVDDNGEVSVNMQGLVTETCLQGTLRSSPLAVTKLCMLTDSSPPSSTSLALLKGTV